jgi:hypothetical protein
MKLIVGLSSLALISLSTVTPSLAASQALDNASNQSLTSQALPDTTKSFQVAGIFDTFNKVLDTVKKVESITEAKKQADRDAQDKTDRDAAAEKAKQERLAWEEQAKIDRQQGATAYQQRLADRKAAAEAQRVEEEAYFNSLTPEQQKAYLARKEAQRKASEQAGWDMLKMIFGSGLNGGGSSASPQDDPDAAYRKYLDEEHAKILQRESDAQHMRNISH